MEHQSTVIQRMTFVKSFTCVDNRPQELYHSWPVDVLQLCVHEKNIHPQMTTGAAHLSV